MDVHNQKQQMEGRNGSMHDEATKDRITNLPDVLLHHILSFLEIKDVARTCVLSRRWNYIWTSFPILDSLSLHHVSHVKELTIQYRFSFPKHVYFPKLKHLKLVRVKFSDESLSLSNCRVLEELTLEHCQWGLASNFCISAPSVKHLKIINDHYGPDQEYLKGRRHSPGLQDCDLNIEAPRLVSLTYKGSFPKDCVLSRSLTLGEADVDGFSFFNDPATIIRFLQVLSHVKVLSIAKQLLKALTFADNLKEVLPTFNSLKHLNVYAAAASGKALVGLLRSAPNLEYLVFDKPTIPPIHYGNEDDYNSGDDGSGCCLLHLKSVYFKKFAGEHREMWWVKLILEQAKELQTMTISHSSPLVSIYKKFKSKEEVMAELSSLFRASATSCVLNFS